MTLPAMPENFERVLCIAAHPDDLEYGAAAAVAKWRASGVAVSYVLATSGEAGIDDLPPHEAGPLREQEERDGALEVGVEVVEFLGFADGSMADSLALRESLAKAIRRHRPDVVLTLTHREQFAGGGINQADHRIVGLAALDACADAGNRWLFADQLTTGLEPWGGVKMVAFANSAHATHQVNVDAYFDSAVASLEAHARYLQALGEDYPTPRELLTTILGDPASGQCALTVELLER